MSDQIKSGDLVMVVKLPSCCGAGSLGYVFTVMGIKKGEKLCCANCGFISEHESAAQHDDIRFIPSSLLKKIKPEEMQMGDVLEAESR